MNINLSIFKKYDLRGKYPEDINYEIAPLLVHLYVKQFAPSEVVVGHDPVQGSSEIYQPVCDELSKLGVKVYKAGMVATPMLYFASAHYKIPQGLMLTASHLGQKYTGIKIVIDGIPPKQEDISAMKQNAENSKDFKIHYPNTPGEQIELTNLKSDYISKICELLGEGSLDKYSIVIDSGNGPNGEIIDEVAQKLGLKYAVINKDIRSKDLSHESNPKVAANRIQLVEEVKRQKADLGIIWDGDGDRAYFIDSNGEIIPPEFIGIQIGSNLINQGLGTTMTIDVRGSASVEKELKYTNGIVKRIVAWHVPIKFEMDKDPSVVFGMETSGHYVFRDLYKADDGLFASMSFLKAINSNTRTLSEMLNDFRNKYLIIEEINFETEKSEQELVDEIESSFRDGSISKIDGITVDYPLWRFNIRASKSEPIIRLNISGEDFALVNKNLEKLKAIIGGKIVE